MPFVSRRMVIRIYVGILIGLILGSKHVFSIVLGHGMYCIVFASHFPAEVAYLEVGSSDFGKG